MSDDRLDDLELQEIRQMAANNLRERQRRKETRAMLFMEVEVERAHQDGQWGGLEHDLRHAPETWALLLARHVGRLAGDCIAPDRDPCTFPSDYRERLVKVAAIAIAALEAHDGVRKALLGNE